MNYLEIRLTTNNIAEKILQFAIDNYLVVVCTPVGEVLLEKATDLAECNAYAEYKIRIYEKDANI